MKNVIYFLFIFLCPLPSFAERWVEDENTKCQVWNDTNVKSSDLNVEWSGECLNGKATGNGVLRMYYIGHLEYSYEGEYKNGQKNGKGVYTEYGKYGNVTGQIESYFRNDKAYDSKEEADALFAQKAKTELEQEYAAAVYEKCTLTPECRVAREREERRRERERREQERKGYLFSARGWCYSIKDKDGLNGCMAGIRLGENDISSARGYCYSIKYDDGKNDCMAGIKLAEYFSQEESDDSEVAELESETGSIESELSAEQKEAQELIREIEATPTLLNNRETRQLYNSLKKIIN